MPQATRQLLLPSTLAALGNLELIARTAVEGFFIGMHRSPKFGFSQEFAEYRQYAEGDDPRFVDWNVFARTERTYIRRYEGETNTRLMIALDASASMGYGSGDVTKLQYAKYLAAALAYLGIAAARSGRADRVRRGARSSYRPPTSRAGSAARRCCTARCERAGRQDRSGRRFRKAARALRRAAAWSR